eukprot:747745-Hanusia_phi.AAC.3
MHSKKLGIDNRLSICSAEADSRRSKGDRAYPGGSLSTTLMKTWSPIRRSQSQTSFRCLARCFLPCEIRPNVLCQHACYFPRDDDEESRPARPAQLVGSVMELRKPSSNDFSDKGFLTSRRNSSSSDTAGLKTARQNRVSSVSAGSLRNVSSSSVRFHLLNEKSHSFSGSLPSTDRSVPVEKHSSVKESKIYRQRDRVEKNKKRYEEAENKRVEMLSKYKEVLKRYSEKGKKISRDQWKDMQDSLKTFEEKRDLEWQRYTSSLVNLQIVSDLPFSSPIR